MNLKEVRRQIYQVGSQISGSNGFFYQEAPENVSFPYISWHLIDDTNERISVGTHTDSIFMQFTLFDRRISTNGKKISSATLEDVALELITRFDASDINVPGYGTLYFKRTLMIPADIVEEGHYWIILVRYELYLTN